MIINFKTPNKTSPWVVSKTSNASIFLDPPQLAGPILHFQFGEVPPILFSPGHFGLEKFSPKKNLEFFSRPKLRPLALLNSDSTQDFQWPASPGKVGMRFFEGPIEMWICCKKNGNKWEGNNRKRLNACVVCIYIYLSSMTRSFNQRDSS